jgi:transposase
MACAAALKHMPVAAIPPMANRRNRPAVDVEAFKQRGLIEHAFCRIDDWCAIATRHDKTARNSLAGHSAVAQRID